MSKKKTEVNLDDQINEAIEEVEGKQEKFTYSFFQQQTWNEFEKLVNSGELPNDVRIDLSFIYSLLSKYRDVYNQVKKNIINKYTDEDEQGITPDHRNFKKVDNELGDLANREVDFKQDDEEELKSYDITIKNVSGISSKTMSILRDNLNFKFVNKAGEEIGSEGENNSK